MNEEMRSVVRNTKEQVFQKMFEKRVSIFPGGRDNQEVDTSLEIKDGRLVLHYDGLRKKYGFKKSWQDIQSEYILQTYLAIESFEVEGESELTAWDGILDGTNALQENRLIKYIKTTVEHRIHEFANPEAFRTSTTVEGQRINYTLILEMESLDELLYDNPENISPIQLDDNNNLFSAEEQEYYISFFQQWFNENRERILTKSQVKFLEDIKRLSSDDTLTKEEFEETTGVRWDSRSKRLTRIEDRIRKAWVEENPAKQGRRKVNSQGRINYFKGFMKLVDGDINPMTQNIQLTDYLIKGMKDNKTEKEMFRITNQAWQHEELILFNKLVRTDNSRRIALKTTSLLKVIDIMEKELNSLLADKPSEYNLEDATHANTAEHFTANQMVKTTPSKVNIYDRDNNFVREEVKYIEVGGKPQNVFYILNTGAWARKE